MEKEGVKDRMQKETKTKKIEKRKTDGVERKKEM